VLLWPTMRFRFRKVEADAETYGGDWRVWDEVALAGLPARELIALEEAVDMRFADIVRGLHREDTMASMAAMWIALHRAGHPVAWDEFNPGVHLADWEQVPLDDAETPDSGGSPKTDSDSSTAPSEESATSS
jgi:hypothetical protein